MISEMMKTPIGRLRLTGMTEGASYLALLFVAMPLKYLAGRPEAVQVVGLLHGLLFITLCMLLLVSMITLRWPFWRGAVVFGASLVPFGPFLIDGWLRKQAPPAQ